MNFELGNFRVEDGKIVVSNQNALGSGKVVAVDDGATLAIQSSQATAPSFNFANQINLGSAGPFAASLELASGNAHISKPIHILNDSTIRLQTGGSELLLDSTGLTLDSYMITTDQNGNCDSATPCQLTIEGPGANQTATLKTFRNFGNVSGDAAQTSDGIRLYGEYGSEARRSPLIWPRIAMPFSGSLGIRFWMDHQLRLIMLNGNCSLMSRWGQRPIPRHLNLLLNP